MLVPDVARKRSFPVFAEGASFDRGSKPRLDVFVPQPLVANRRIRTRSRGAGKRWCILVLRAADIAAACASFSKSTSSGAELIRRFSRVLRFAARKWTGPSRRKRYAIAPRESQASRRALHSGRRVPPKRLCRSIDSQGNTYGTDPETPSNLYRIDAATGAATLVGSTRGEGQGEGCSFRRRQRAR